MQFNSINFFLFFLSFAVIYFITPKKLKNFLFLISNLGFIYLFTNSIENVLIIIFLVFINFLLGFFSPGKFYFLIAVIVNISLIILFKIADLYTGTSEVITSLIPLGYSYMIFQFISYQIEINRKRILPEKNLINFINYITLFPKITQGPIERPYSILPVFNSGFNGNINYDGMKQGIMLILLGLFKKLVIADRLAIYVNTVYNNYEEHSGISLIVATLFFSFQIYADFSGYSDMVVGLGKILNINFINNFERPYMSLSIKELWNRWHISLSHWLRDYIFLPLSYRLKAHYPGKKYFGIKADNIFYTIVTFTTFTLCGLWHGFYFKYVIWGWIISLYLVLPFIFKKRIGNFNKKIKLNKKGYFYLAFKPVITLLLMSLTWVFFRASDSESAFKIIAGMTKFSGSLFLGGNDNSIFIYSVIGIFMLSIYELQYEVLKKRILFFNNKNIFVRYFSYVIIIILILVLGVFDGGQFIYQQF